MESKDDIEKAAEKEDCWGFKTNPEDAKRRSIIIARAAQYGWYSDALDIGAHEGFITEHLPADRLSAYELSDNAASRLPKTITRVSLPTRGYDLVLATGVFYSHYRWSSFVEIINRCATNIILTCNIKNWEVPGILQIRATQIHEEEFDYREYVQKLRVFRV